MQDTDVLILGAGAAGLSCRMGLKDSDREVTVLERDDQPGGLLRVYTFGDFTFDTVLHVLFFRDPLILEQIRGWLPLGLRSFQKKNLVWQHQRAIPYPYQFNAWALPEEVRRHCLEHLPQHTAELPPEATFSQWLLAQFGHGFYQHFFGPYNRKLYGEDPDNLEAAPMTWTIPADNLRAIRRGAQGPPTTQISANSASSANSHYPRGPQGISAVIDALLQRGHGPIHTRTPVVRVNLQQRQVWTRDGRCWNYKSLVNTLPLPLFLRLVENLPQDLEQGLKRLRAAPVTVIRVGAHGRTNALDADWTYFPDEDLPFYRITRQERIAPDLSPEGSTALLLECPGSSPPNKERVLEALCGLGVLPDKDVAHYSVLHLPCAYVLFLKEHRQVLKRARDWLSQHRVHLAGRYGQWRYANIEQTIQSGWSCAEALRSTSLSPGPEVLRTRATLHATTPPRPKPDDSGSPGTPGEQPTRQLQPQHLAL